MKNAVISLFAFLLMSCTSNGGYQDVDVTNFKKGIENDVTLLDVRTPAEWDSGIIEGAVMINVFDAAFDTKASELDKSKPLYVYCKSGGRSTRAANKLVSLGFTQVYNLSGGITAWTGNGEKTVNP